MYVTKLNENSDFCYGNMPHVKKPGGRCKAGSKQAAPGSTACVKNDEYFKGHKSHLYKETRGEVSMYRKDGKADRRFKKHKILKKSGTSVNY